MFSIVGIRRYPCKHQKITGIFKPDVVCLRVRSLAATPEWATLLKLLMRGF